MDLYFLNNWGTAKGKKLLALKKGGLGRGQYPHAPLNNFSDLKKKIAVFVTSEDYTFKFSKQFEKKNKQ